MPFLLLFFKSIPNPPPSHTKKKQTKSNQKNIIIVAYSQYCRGWLCEFLLSMQFSLPKDHKLHAKNNNDEEEDEGKRRSFVFSPGPTQHATSIKLLNSLWTKFEIPLNHVSYAYNLGTTTQEQKN